MSGEYPQDRVEVTSRRPDEKPAKRIVVKFLRCHGQMVLPFAHCPRLKMCKGICRSQACPQRYARLTRNGLLVRIEDKDAAFWRKPDGSKYMRSDGILDYTSESMQQY